MAEFNFNPPLWSEPQMRVTVVRCLGNGTGTPTEVFGAGVTITRTGVGVWRITYSYPPNNYVGILGFTFDDTTTAANVKGYTISSTPFAFATKSIDVSIWSSAFAAVDLTSAQSLTLMIGFKVTNA